MSEPALTNFGSFAMQRHQSRSGESAPWFTKLELKRVGTAATMIVVLGTSIILLMLILMGHYNSLAHCFPKAVMDGAVIALLIGRKGRWRLLGLLGVVYGLVLVLQLGVVYLFPVIAIAGLVAALVGRGANWVDRTFAVLLAAATYELLAGFASPIKIYFGTDGHREPFVWAMWFMEWPLRVIGAAIGAWAATRWAENRKLVTHRQAPALREENAPAQIAITPDIEKARSALRSHGMVDRSIRVRGIAPAALRIVIAIAGCVLPMCVSSTLLLATFAVLYVGYALYAGLRWRVLHAVLGLVWGWAVFSLLSYLWNHDPQRVIDMLRSFVLRFAPLALGAMVLVATVRPVDVIRLLRKLRVGGIILIPLSHVVRSVPQARREVMDGITRLRAAGHWRGPWSVIRHPKAALNELILPPLSRWGASLLEA